MNSHHHIRHVRLPFSNGSFAASIMVSVMVGAVWFFLHHHEVPIPSAFGVATGAVLSWLMLEVLIRTKFKAQIEPTAQPGA